MTVNQQITGIILAGGKSSRMGISKAWLTIENKRFIENAISILRPYCHNILISANTREYNTYGYEVVCDRYPSIGPMGGLEACLNRSETEKNLVIPCDVPNISAMIIHHILHSVNDADVVVPIWDNNTLEPLIGYYSKRIYPIIIEQIEKREYSIIQLLRRVQTRYVHLHGFKLHNVNTPTDYWVSTQQCRLSERKPYMPWLIVVSGTGRKVGKTRLACDIIAHLSKKLPVIAVKVSNHFHAVEAEQKQVAGNRNFQVFEEQLITTKDSSRMRQAGALRSYYIQATDEFVHDAFQVVLQRVDQQVIIICESNNLTRFVTPALHLLVCNAWPLEDEIIQKFSHAIPVRFSDEGCSIDVTNIDVNALTGVFLKSKI